MPRVASFDNEVAREEGVDEESRFERDDEVVPVFVLRCVLELELLLRLDTRVVFLAGKGGGGMFSVSTSADDIDGAALRSLEGESED